MGLRVQFWVLRGMFEGLEAVRLKLRQKQGILHSMASTWRLGLRVLVCELLFDETRQLASEFYDVRTRPQKSESVYYYAKTNLLDFHIIVPRRY